MNFVPSCTIVNYFPFIELALVMFILAIFGLMIFKGSLIKEGLIATGLAIILMF